MAHANYHSRDNVNATLLTREDHVAWQQFIRRDYHYEEAVLPMPETVDTLTNSDIFTKPLSRIH